MTEKVILITGASSGIGAASAKKLVADGHKVALTARREDKLSELVSELGADNAVAFPADATDYQAQCHVVEKTVAHYGRLDAAFANAGTGVSTPGTEDGNVEEWDALIDINVKALLYTAKATLPHLRKTEGHFLLTSSAAGRRPIKGSIYGASKWFAYGFGQNLAEEMEAWKGRCTTICPGVVNTPFFDEPKDTKIQPEDVADAVSHAIAAPHRTNIREVYMMPTYTG
ncbi:short-chain dehydrogenase [Alteromonas halophila]|uniref:Short-chain dehydrogenase n=2 Tax=Alteromonas halophila TaxID=516698 RepID=A0A918JRU6_9ALTE|nr:short-chain dehydrogenase [Alteromonas halophila]